MAATYLLALSLLLALAVADPLVTLNHGGQLRGKQFDYNGTNINLFLGVPYAEPPTGSLRFEKPRQARPWKGIKVVKTAGNICPQTHPLTGKIIGDEDCLVLDITVSEGVDPTKKKPVMVWIHGGSYISGSKNAYSGATLAKHGDVIVVAINYRLGLLGFLSDGPGTGNYGLWDQRAALLWIQENIALFGGDPDLVTIFGESAGAGSVSAQMMGQHNDGLFKRAIQESGTLYVGWGWFLSKRQRYDLVVNTKKMQRCSPTQTVYDCLRGQSVETLFSAQPELDILNVPWRPTSDQDFFSPSVLNESYDLTERFDLLAGFCEQEAAIAAFLPTIANKTQESIQDGISRSYVELALSGVCQSTTPLSIDLCVQFLMNTYKLDEIDDDKKRAIRLSFAQGELWYNADTIRQLSAHAEGPRSTYAFQFSENFVSSAPLWPPAPAWSEISASHGDDLTFVFGGIYNKENHVRKEYLGEKVTPDMIQIAQLMDSATESDKALTDLIMTAWTNFAKSGNPNQPTLLPSGAPEWPQFNRDTNQFIEFKSGDTKVITTPNKERLDKLVNSLFAARTSQLKADVVPAPPCGETDDKRDSVIG